MPRMPKFDVKVHPVTGAESNSSLYEDWCEVSLLVQRDGGVGNRVDLTRSAAEEILEKLHLGIHPWAGKSIQENVRAELDAVVSRLLSDGKPDDVELQMDPRTAQDEWRKYGEDRGMAQGLAYVLALFRNPYKPDIEAIKKESIARARGLE